MTRSEPDKPFADPSVDSFEGEVTLQFFRFQSDDGAFCVAEVEASDGETYPAVGALSHLEEGQRARVAGKVQEHPRHGLQLAVASAVPLDPAGPEAAKAYLRSISGIGEARAEALIAAHGDDPFGAIDENPEAAFAAVRGIGSQTAAQAAEEWEERRSQRDLYTLLAPLGLARLTAELYSVHGLRAPRVIRDEPYSLTSMHGVGFRTADRLARSLGLALDSPERTLAGAIHALAEAEQRGHTFLPLAELIEALRGLLELEPQISHLRGAQGLTMLEGRIYRDRTLEWEQRLGSQLAALAAAGPSGRLARSEATSTTTDSGLTETQEAAIAAAFRSRLSMITGGPGTGKTHLTFALLEAAISADLSFELCAPTGRAAKRLSEATNDTPAHTIHKLLDWIPGEEPGHDSSSPLEIDMIVCDEASMLSLEICSHLVDAIGAETHLVLIGDADQLPPVGPGKPFAELVELAPAPVSRLDHVFRQAQQSMIVGAAHAVRAGRAPDPSPPTGAAPDFFRHSRSRAEDLAADVVEMACTRIPDRLGLDPAREVQILAPQYKGALGIDALHEGMREKLCAGAAKCMNGRFLLGEKLITTRGNPELEIANGTTFLVAGDEPDNSELLLETETGEIMPLRYRHAGILRGGFCASVHRAQGMEIPAVIVCLHSSHNPMLASRNLLYTALTRAQLFCVLAGDDRAISRALANTDAMRRHSGLGEWLEPPGGPPKLD